MTYYVQQSPDDMMYYGGSSGLSDTSGSGYLAALYSNIGGSPDNIINTSGPQLDFSSPDDMMSYGGWDMPGNTAQQQGNASGQNDLYGYDYGMGDYSDFGGGYNPWGGGGGGGGGGGINYGYEYGPTFDPYGYGTGMNDNYGYDYGAVGSEPSNTYYDSGGQGYYPSYGYDTYGGYGGGAYGSTSNLDDLSSRYNTSIQSLPRVGNQIDLQTGGIPRVSALGHGSSWTESRQPARGTPPRPPQAPSRSLPTLVNAQPGIPLPGVRDMPGSPDYNVMAQPHAAWDRLQNFIDNPMAVLENDPMYRALLSEGNRNRAAQHRAGRTRFSGTAGVDFEKFGVEAAAQNLERIANMYGTSAQQELGRWQPAAQLDLQAQERGFGDSLDAWRAGQAADFQRYALNQGDVRNLIAANTANNQANNAYYSDQGSQDMLNYFYNMQNFYGY